MHFLFLWLELLRDLELDRPIFVALQGNIHHSRSELVNVRSVRIRFPEAASSTGRLDMLCYSGHRFEGIEAVRASVVDV